MLTPADIARKKAVLAAVKAAFNGQVSVTNAANTQLGNEGGLELVPVISGAVKAVNVLNDFGKHIVTAIATVEAMVPDPIIPPVIPVPVDCVMSEWSAWAATGPWTPCESGLQSRPEIKTRTVITPASNGGVECGPTTETRTAIQECSIVVIPPVSAVPPPVLWFADMASGPSIGNSDVSLGQLVNANGAIVTIWGVNLGDEQGSSDIFCAGVPASYIHYWGPAKPPWSPANLNNGHQRYQVICFQVSHFAMYGLGQITVKVNGQISNPLPFTVRPGRIFYVAKNGSNGPLGTFAKPFQTIDWAHKNYGNQPGDTIYCMDGVTQTVDDSHYALRFRHRGTEAAPISLVAYPGATCNIGRIDGETFAFYVDQNNSAPWHTISKFTLIGARTVILAPTGTRTTGCKISAPNGVGQTGTCTAGGNNVHYLGNEFTQCGRPTNPDSLYHVLYAAGSRGYLNPLDAVNRVIAFNNFHDNAADCAVNLYNQPEPYGSGLPYMQKIRDTNVHHNLMLNQTADAVRIHMGHYPRVWAHTNLMIRCSKYGIFVGGPAGNLGPPPMEPTGHFVAHNTAIDCGYGSSVVTVNGEFAVTLNANNLNLQRNGKQYVGVGSGSKPPPADGRWNHNLYYGNNLPAPVWDNKNSVNKDPMIVGGDDAHLQAGSPAIGAGTELVATIPGIEFDFDGNRRGPTYDIGAYQGVAK